ncbi:hypothetical protein [Veillonella rodentium]|uniref:Elongation factor Tu n=1 Tax=Veillonella rodentium TaxID=248315 RepID=A0A239YDJ8_9FIRM|nr:hypothetical protein [Veillonella rodentium]SNV56298.1 Uncharacterised protein [Veillonella rodentium]
MSNLDFTIGCTVTFFSKKRTSLPNLNYGMYCPHFVIKGTEEYLSINFIDGEDVIFDKEIGANALPLYETVDYSALQAGTEFFIMEGGNVVGEGIVKEIFQHKPHEKK